MWSPYNRAYPRTFYPRNYTARRNLALRRRGVRLTDQEAIDQIRAQIISIKTTMASGVEMAAYGDKKTEFRSLEELREILNALEEELDDLLGIGGRIRQIRMTTPWDKAL